MSHDRFEEGYLEGKRRVGIEILTMAMRNLEGKIPDVARLILERQQALATLHRICQDLKIPNNWPENLHFSDILDKYIAPHVNKREIHI